MYAPLILFTYNRPVHTQKVLESLNDSPLAKETDLYIFCDYPKGELTSKNIAVRNYLLEFKNISRFKSTTLYISDKHKVNSRNRHRLGYLLRSARQNTVHFLLLPPALR